MVKKGTVLFLLFLVALSLGGCSLIRTDPAETITIKSNPEGADCSLSRGGEIVGQVNPTPGDVTVDRNKHDLSVVCKKSGFKDSAAEIKSGIAGTVVSNILATDFVGMVVDAASGADNSYPGETTVELVPIEESRALEAAGVPPAAASKSEQGGAGAPSVD